MIAMMAVLNYDLLEDSRFTAYIAASSSTEKVPHSYSDAMQHPDWNKWLAAMECEIEKLTNKNVWDLV